MLPAGGSYVSLVSPDVVADCSGEKPAHDEKGFCNVCSEKCCTKQFTMVVQTMEHDMSQCFKDTHPPFTVAAQNARCERCCCCCCCWC